MAALTGLAMGITAASSLTGFFSQRNAARGAEAAGKYEQKVFETNAEVADMQAQDAIARGREAEMRQRRAGHRLIGSQRAALAAQGIEVDSGSALDVQKDTAGLSELDALTIRNNAAREAWGFTVQAMDLRNQGRLARMGAKTQAQSLRNQSVSTLLSGASEMFSMYNNSR